MKEKKKKRKKTFSSRISQATLGLKFQMQMKNKGWLFHRDFFFIFYIYNVCHDPGFCRKPRPVNSVNYQRGFSVVEISQHSVNFDLHDPK